MSAAPKKAAPGVPQGRTEALPATLCDIAKRHAPAAFASSLGAEDMVLTDAILRTGLRIEIFTLDTGRLHDETLAVLERVRAHYGYSIRVYRPDQQAVERYVQTFGRDAFFKSVDLRQGCCAIRKVEPLARALSGKAAWITGLRRAQSVARRDLPLQERDTEHGLWKFNPLVEWSESEVWDYLRARAVPYNVLHDHGFRSIGCAPCTRPIAAGEDLRAGRWWWENEDTKECGLHRHPLTQAQPARTA